MIDSMSASLSRIALTTAVCVLLGLLAARLRVSMPAAEPRGRLSAEAVQPAGQIYEGVAIRQEFPAEGTRIRSVELHLATYARQNEGAIALQVERYEHGRWKQLTVQTMEKRLLVDNAWQIFAFDPPLKVHLGEQVALTLTADLDVANAITWWISPGVRTENHQLLVNGKPRDGHANFSVEYEPVSGKAGYTKMRPRLWRRLTVFLGALGKTMLVAGSMLALFCLVHLSMHAPRVLRTNSRRTVGEADTGEVRGLVDALMAACRASTWRAAWGFLRAQAQRHGSAARYGFLLLAVLGLLTLVAWLARRPL